MIEEEDAMTDQPGGPHAEFVPREASRVRIFTLSGLLEGMHHHMPGVRLSDYLRNQVTGERYLLLTDVTIHPTGGASSHASFVLVNTQHVTVIVPDEQESAQAA
jgi:hypothetical protein